METKKIEKHKVFVYGTLKKGFCNNKLLDGFSCKRAIARGIDLHNGPGFPYAKRGNGEVIGELYEVDTQTMKRLDRLEGCPNLYQREKTEVIVNSQKVEAWIYLSQNATHFEKIESGVWHHRN